MGDLCASDIEYNEEDPGTATEDTPAARDLTVAFAVVASSFNY
jgi:hypothetical protein